MEAFVIYSLKAGACLAVFCLFYKLLLRRETFHRLNRLLLLGGVVVSYLLPLCIVTFEREAPVSSSDTEVVAALPELTDAITETLPVRIVSVSLSDSFPWALAAGAVLAAGGVVALMWMLKSFRDTRRMIRRGACRYLNDGILLSLHNEHVRPFSWWHWIVLSEDDFNQNGEAIVVHEQAHLRCGHTYDLLAVDLLGCLQWFNPAMWMLRRELCALHEYEADAAVLAAGADAKNYQLLLVKKAVGGRWYSVANSLNHSNLKNRITMMLRKKSSRWAAAKALLVLPLLCLGLAAFARTSYAAPAGESGDKVTEKSQIPQGFTGGMTVKPADGGVWVVTLDGTGDAMLGTIGLIALASPASEDELVDMREIMNMLLPLTSDPDAPGLGLASPYCLVDDRVLAAGEAVPDASQIDGLTILLKRAASEKFGPDGANGAVLIVTKKPDQPSKSFAAESLRNDPDRPWFRGTGLYGFPGRGAGYSGATGGGRVPTEAEYEQMLEASKQQEAQRSPERTFNGIIASRVFDGKVVFTLHGVGDAMMAASSMFQQDSKYADMQRMLYRLSRSVHYFPDLMAVPEPLCLVDGQPVAEVPQAEYVARIEVLDAAQGLAAYGEDGADGVVSITSKKPDASNLSAVQAVLATGEAGMMSCMAEDGTLDPPTTTHGFYWERPAAK